MAPAEPTDRIGDAEDANETLAWTFAKEQLRAVADHPIRTYLLLSHLLNQFGEWTPGLDAQQVEDDLRGFIDHAETFSSIQECKLRLTQLFSKIVRPTYVAASFWSPLDRQRHTIFSRSRPATEQERREVLAHACAFYALSLAGPKDGYFATIQYTATTPARKKRGPRVSYAPTLSPPNVDELWWHIPRETHEGIFRDTGLPKAIQDHFSSLSEEELTHRLRLTLENRDRQWEEDAHSFADSYIASFSDRLQHVSSPTRQAIQTGQSYIQQLFGERITEEKAFFMLATNLLWQKACPANQFYAFLVRVENDCSVMTIGTDVQLSAEQHLALNGFVTSVLIQPLLLNYASKKAREKVEKEEIEWWQNAIRTIRHRIGNPTSVLRTNLDSMEKRLTPERIEEAKEVLGWMRESTHRIKTILDHIKKYVENKPSQMEPLEILPLLQRVQQKMAPSQGLDCELDCARGLIVNGSSVRLSEGFGELLENSRRWCTMGGSKRVRIVAKRASSSQVVYPLDPDKAYVHIRFSDNGPGVQDDIKDTLFNFSETRYAEGDGLGLAILRRDITTHLGMIRLVPKEDLQLSDLPGANFDIFLPLFVDPIKKEKQPID